LAESGTDALTEAEETLAEVELIDSEEVGDTANLDATAESTEEAEAETTDATATDTPATTAKAWYQEFLDDPKRLAIAGIGAVGLLGVIGTLLFRRKRKDSEVSGLDDFDRAGFDDDDFDSTRSGISASGVGLAGAAGAVGVAAASAEDPHDITIAKGDIPPVDETPVDLDGVPVNNDDTIAEVDVYLAYGLHGQAEELLGKAIDRNPDNPEYAAKLLQIFHAQGNGDAFHANAVDFHQRFGGDRSPEWTEITAMGVELKPEEPLYSAAHQVVDPASAQTGIGTSPDGASAQGLNEVELASIDRDLNNSGDDLIGDETLLMDDSIDPAFAFDAGDLDASGDFGSTTDEVAAEANLLAGDNNFDTSGFTQSDAENGRMAGGMRLDDIESSLDDDLSLAEVNDLSESVDDLTLDLDQLSGDLDLDSADLLNPDISDLEIPDLTADNDLLHDPDATVIDDADEIGTMMDLAKAYIDIGDKDSASNALDEIVKSGSPEQVTEAETLLRKIS